MTLEDFYLERLTHRLAECPADFLAEPKMGRRGEVHVDAVVSDLMMDLGGGPLSEKGAQPFRVSDKNKRNWLRLVLVGTWLCHDENLRSAGVYSKPVYTWLKQDLEGLAALVSADLFVTDPDRREELARLCLRALNLRPLGETENQAQDRLKTLSSVDRARIIADTKAKEEKARRLRKAEEERRAREAAAKPMHE